MKHSICDIKDCGKVAYDEVALRANYWLGDKVIKIDVCLDHEKEILKVLGFDSEYNAKRAYGNKWRNTKD